MLADHLTAARIILLADNLARSDVFRIAVVQQTALVPTAGVIIIKAILGRGQGPQHT